MTTRDSHDGPRDDAARHRAIVARLISRLAPVRRPWPVWARLVLWIGLAMCTVALAAGIGLRDDLTIQLERPLYLMTVAVLLSGAGLAATAALLAAVPGRIRGSEARALGIGVLALAITTALLGEPAHGTTPSTFLLTGLRCTVCVAAFALLPWLALIVAVSRAAPMDGRVTGLCVGVAACLVGAASVRVACPIDDTVHLAVWHGLPVALWTTCSMTFAGTRLTRWLEATRASS